MPRAAPPIAARTLVTCPRRTLRDVQIETRLELASQISPDPAPVVVPHPPDLVAEMHSEGVSQLLATDLSNGAEAEPTMNRPPTQSRRMSALMRLWV